MSTQIIHTALAADAIKQYQDEIERIRRWPAGPRRDHHLATREQLIEEMEAVIELADEMAEAECEMAEVIEIATPAQQLEEVAADADRQQPRRLERAGVARWSRLGRAGGGLLVG